MIFITIGLCVLGVVEVFAYRKYHYPEDVILTVVSFGLSAFLFALWEHLP